MKSRPETALTYRSPPSELTTMTLTFDAAPRPAPLRSRIKLDAPFLGASSLTFLKPRLKATVRPLAGKRAGMGVTANQGTLASLAGSLAVGGVLCANPDNTMLFALLPLWLPIRPRAPPSTAPSRSNSVRTAGSDASKGSSTVETFREPGKSHPGRIRPVANVRLFGQQDRYHQGDRSGDRGRRDPHTRYRRHNG